MKLEDRFGDYLLFRRLATSPLGSTYRAGRLQARAIDRVVLLHRFDGESVDRERLADDAAARAGLLRLLTAPHFAQGLAAGSEQGVPYVAYDYLLGRTLEETLRRAAEISAPPETSYVLSLVEQAAAGLAAAARQRLDGAPIRHGFLVPELLLLSAEGRVYPLGFSHGAALVRQEALRQCFAPYLAPETLAGAAPLGDDVYSLAAILFEGLTGAPPEPAGEGTATQVDRAMFGRAGAPLSPQVQDLLKSGLAPAGSRPRLAAFHQSLRRLLRNREDSPSQFQLAFFLHQLFRDELEAEAVEMQGERTARFDPLLLTPPPAEESAAAPELPEPLPAPLLPTSPEATAATPARRRGISFFAGMAASLAVALIISGLVHLGRRGPGAAPAEAAPPGGAGDVEVEVQRLAAAGAADLHQRLEEEFEPRLSRLRSELQAAQEAQEAKAARAASRPRRQRRAEATGAPTVPVEESEAANAASLPAAPAVAGPPPAGPSPAADGAPASDPAAEDANTRTEAIAANAQAPPSTAPAGEAGVPPEASATARPEPADVAGSEPRTAGDGSAVALAVEPEPDPAGKGAEAAEPAGGGGRPPDEPRPMPPAPQPPVDPIAAPGAAEPAADTFSPPRLLAPPQPRYPPLAQRLRKSARVRVRVLVDAEGRAAETEVISDPAGFGFDESAIAAAAKTRWEPARRDGVATSAWAVLTIDFRL